MSQINNSASVLKLTLITALCIASSVTSAATFNDLDSEVAEAGQAVPINIDAYAEVDISMTLDTPGTVSGKVIDEVTQLGIAEARVIFYRMPGLTEKTILPTDQSGYFETDLPAGEYQVQTNVPGAFGAPELYIPELWDDVHCTSFRCDNELGNGTPLVVQDSTMIDNVNIALSRTATISGQITDQDTGTLIDIASIEATEINTGLSYSHNYTDGNFQITGILPGTYKIRTYTYHNDYLEEYYDNHVIWENPGAFTPLLVEAATSYNVDFSLKKKASIFGLVSDEQTGQPIFDAVVRLYDLNDNWVSGGRTAEDGRFEVFHYPGNYKVIVEKSQYIPELYDNIPCIAYSYITDPELCLSGSDPVIVELALDMQVQVDVELSKGSRISGVVTDEETALPITGVNYRLWNENHREMNNPYEYTDSNGAYYIGKLPAGRYYLYMKTARDSQFVDEFYDDVPCISLGDCDFSEIATPIDIFEPADIEINIQLSKGFSISGTVTEQLTGAPISRGKVVAYTMNWRDAGVSLLQADGQYTIPGLVAGDYYLLFTPWPPYDDFYEEAYDDVVCPDWACDYKSMATPVTLEEGGHLVINAQLMNHVIFRNGFE